MKTFSQYIEDAWGHHEEDQQLFASIEAKIADLGKDVSSLCNKLSHGDSAVNHAYTHFVRSFDTLSQTCKTAVKKNTVNPERGDHPPITLDS
jgi:hypothetical protein